MFIVDFQSMRTKYAQKCDTFRWKVDFRVIQFDFKYVTTCIHIIYKRRLGSRREQGRTTAETTLQIAQFLFDIRHQMCKYIYKCSEVAVNLRWP